MKATKKPEGLIKEGIGVTAASLLAIFVLFGVVLFAVQESPEDLYTSLRTRPDEVTLINYQVGADNVAHLNNPAEPLDAQDDEADEPEGGKLKAFFAPNATSKKKLTLANSEDPTNAALDGTDENRAAYLNRGVVEYYTTYDSNSTEQLIYSELTEAAYNGQHFTDYDFYDPSNWLGGYLDLAEGDIAPEEITTILEEVTYDYPMLSIYKTGQPNLVSSVDNCGYYAIETPVTTNADIDCAPLYAEVEERANEINQTAFDQSQGSVKRYINSVYKQICENNRYSDDVNDTIHANDIYGALIEGESKCYGDSCAFKYILDKQEIPNYIATGMASNGQRHAWNIVWYDNEWRICDLTIGSKGSDGQEGSVKSAESATLQDHYTGCLVEPDKYYKVYQISIDDRSSEIGTYFEEQLLDSALAD